MTRIAKLSIIALLVNISLGYSKEKNPSVKEIKEVSTEISTLLNEEVYEEETNFKLEGSVKVYFSIDADSKVTLVNVASNDQNINEFVKTNLLGKKLNNAEYTTGNVYCFTLKFNK